MAKSYFKVFIDYKINVLKNRAQIVKLLYTSLVLRSLTFQLFFMCKKDYVNTDIKHCEKFKTISNSDFEYSTLIRVFTGRITKKRYKLIDSYCRSKCYSTNCSHEWDCCGCLHNQSVSFSYSFNQVKIKITQSFNY